MWVYFMFVDCGFRAVSRRAHDNAEVVKHQIQLTIVSKGDQDGPGWMSIHSHFLVTENSTSFYD